MVNLEDSGHIKIVIVDKVVPQLEVFVHDGTARDRSLLSQEHRRRYSLKSEPFSPFIWYTLSNLHR